MGRGRDEWGFDQRRDPEEVVTPVSHRDLFGPVASTLDIPRRSRKSPREKSLQGYVGLPTPRGSDGRVRRGDGHVLEVRKRGPLNALFSVTRRPPNNRPLFQVPGPEPGVRWGRETNTRRGVTMGGSTTKNVTKAAPLLGVETTPAKSGLFRFLPHLLTPDP